MDEGGFSVVLELERLRGAVNEGFAAMSGRLDGVLQRTSDAENDLEKLEKRLDETAKDHESRLAILERKVWAAAGAAAVLSGGGVAGVLQIISTR